VRPNALEHPRPACLKTSVESRACSRLRCSCCAAGGDGLQEAVTDLHHGFKCTHAFSLRTHLNILCRAAGGNGLYGAVAGPHHSPKCLLHSLPKILQQDVLCRAAGGDGVQEAVAGLHRGLRHRAHADRAARHHLARAPAGALHRPAGIPQVRQQILITLKGQCHLQR